MTPLAPIVIAILALPPGASQAIEADLDGDGVPDLVWTARDGGSGYSDETACVLDGATGATTCVSVVETAYGPFAGLLSTRDGAPMPLGDVARDPLGAVVLPFPCVAPDRTSPRQGAMWRLGAPSPGGGVVDLPPLRTPGPPQPQDRVCMSPGEAALLEGAFAWEASGTLDAPSAAAAGWTVACLFHGPPVVELEAGPLVFFRSHAAVAVWHRAANVHGWLLNLADGSEEGFKVDRWPRVSDFRQDGESVSFKVHHTGLPQRLVVDLRTWHP